MAIIKTDIAAAQRARNLQQVLPPYTTPDPQHTYMSNSRWQAGNGARFTVKCRERQWKIHSSVVRAQSTLLNKTCTNQSKEGTTNILELPEDTPFVVHAILEYMYTGTYGNGLTDSAVVSQELKALDAVEYLQRNSALYLAAEEYEVLVLKELVLHNLEVIHAVIGSNT